MEEFEKLGIEVVLQGKKGFKVVRGVYQEVILYIGIASGELQVGFISPGRDVVSASLLENSIITGWRALKILEPLEHIEVNTLPACLFLTARSVSKDSVFFNSLAKQFKSPTDLQMLRDRILKSGPSAKELEAMLGKLEKRNMKVDMRELSEAMKAGHIEKTPLIESIFQKEKEEQQAIEKEIKTPVPAKESLGVFLEELGYSEFFAFVCPGIKAYIDAEHLDGVVKRDTYIKTFGEQHILKGINSKPEDSNFSETEIPTTTVDGAVCTFLLAKYRQGKFYVRIRIQKKGYWPADMDCTVAQLREFINNPKSHAIALKEQDLKTETAN
ncbi:hypothetical protein KAR26_01285 [Candidatus Parcubacteria bacterium]|nr:hypothetical protein [Candidatus Parcubacteria bacterium]